MAKVTLLILYVLPFFVLSFVLVLKWLYRREYKMLKSFYAIPALPIIGHIHHFSLDMKERVHKAFEFLEIREFPAVIYISWIPIALIAKGRDVHMVLSISDNRGLMKYFKNIFQNGIIVTNGAKYCKSKRICSSVFSPSMMNFYLVNFNKYSALLVSKFEKYANTGKSLDIWPLVCNLNIDVIFDNMGGNYKLNLLEKEDNEFATSLELCADLDSMRFTTPILTPDFMFKLYLYFTNQRKAMESAINTIRDAILVPLREFKMNKKKEAISEKGDTLYGTLMDVLIKTHYSDPSYTEDNAHGDYSNIIVSGSVTTARAVSFALLMFAMHPELQEKAYQEIESTIENKDQPVKLEDLKKLVYLEQCINETLRKYPPVTMTFRKHPQDIVLNEKQTIPANVNIAIGIISLHNDKHVYPNPEIWNPDRFTKEMNEKREKWAFMPFGVGPRSCIGGKYAMVSIKTQLVHILRTYRLTTDMKLQDVHLGINVVLKNENDYRMKLWKRNN